VIKTVFFTAIIAIGRLLLLCAGALLLLGASACSILFDAPPGEADAEQTLQRLGKTVQEQADTLAQQSRQPVGDAQQSLSSELMFSTDAKTASEHWPVMRIERAASSEHPPQLVLEAPMRGIVWLDGREIGLVQEGSVRIVTLSAGEHQIRVKHPLAPLMTAQFYIEMGERIRLRWESR